MSEFTEDQMELFERRLAERVTERVQTALFRLYATAGVAVIAVVGFFSWDVVTDLKIETKQELKLEIEQEIKEKRSKINEQFIETDIISKRMKASISDLEKQLEAFAPQAENLDETLAKVSQLNVTSQDLLVSYNKEVKPLLSSVESITQQLKSLTKQVEQLNNLSASNESGTSEQSNEQVQKRANVLQSLIQQSTDVEKELKLAKDSVTVFFHFTGGLRGQAQDLSDAIKARGYTVPSEDRQRAASAKSEVRFFHATDKSVAQQLVLDINTSLEQLGYAASRVRVSTKSFVSYKGKKPKAGVLELWLELPLKK